MLNNNIPQSILFGSIKLQTNKVVLFAVEKSIKFLQFAYQEVIAIVKNKDALGFNYNELRIDQKIILNAIKKNGYSFDYFSNILIKNRDLILKVNRSHILNSNYKFDFICEYPNTEKPKIRFNVIKYGYPNAIQQSYIEMLIRKRDTENKILFNAIKYGYIDKLFREYGSEHLFELAKYNKRPLLVLVRKYKCMVPRLVNHLASVWWENHSKVCIDKEIILISVAHDGDALQFASKKLCADRNVVLSAVKQSCSALEFASKEMQGDEEVVLIAVEENGNALKFASNTMCDNKKVVSRAVMKNGVALRFASKRLRSDQKIVSIAVMQDGLALQYADKDLRENQQVVLIAVTQNGNSLRCCQKAMKENKDVVLTAVAQNGNALLHASKEMKENKDVVLTAVAQNGTALQFASKEMQGDKDVVSIAVKQNGNALQFSSDTLCADRDVVEIAINNRGSLEFVSNKLHTDREFVLNAIKTNCCSHYRHSNIFKTGKVYISRNPYSNYILDWIVQCFHLDDEIIFNSIKYSDINDLLSSTKMTTLAKTNRTVLLFLLQKLNHVEFNENTKIERFCLILFGSKIIPDKYKNAMHSNLRVSILDGLILIIELNDFKPVNNLYKIKLRSMGCEQYSISIDNSTTFALLSIKIKEMYDVNNVIFVYGDKRYDLVDYDKKCVEYLTC